MTHNESVEQVLLGDDTPIKRKPTREDYQKEFYEHTLIELKGIRARILDGSITEVIELEDESNWEEVHKFRRMLGSWWYCNHIVGWNNNIPSSDDFNYEYDGVPDNECMADSIRDCFLAVQRGEVDLVNISKVIEDNKPSWDTETRVDIEREEEIEEDIDEAELEELNEMTVTQHKKATKKIVDDKAQPGLSGWF